MIWFKKWLWDPIYYIMMYPIHIFDWTFTLYDVIFVDFLVTIFVIILRFCIHPSGDDNSP